MPRLRYDHVACQRPQCLLYTLTMARRRNRIGTTAKQQTGVLSWWDTVKVRGHCTLGPVATDEPVLGLHIGIRCACGVGHPGVVFGANDAQVHTHCQSHVWRTFL